MFRPELSISKFNKVVLAPDSPFLTMGSLYQLVSNVESLLALHSLHMEELDEDIDPLMAHLNGPEEAYSYAFSLKDEGNSFFKASNFFSALDCYIKAVKLVCLIVPVLCEQSEGCASLPGCKEFVISLHLNIAICELKLGNHENVIHMCSLVLKCDSNNVKALFRRGCALVKLGRSEEALQDLNQAMAKDPNNNDIRILLQKVQGTFTPLGLGYSLKHKKARITVNSNNCLEKEDFMKDKSGVIGSVVDEGKRNSSLKDILLTSPRKSSEEEQIQGMDFNVSNGEPREDGEVESSGKLSSRCSSNSQPASKGKVVFFNKKRPHASIQISREDVEKLRNGKELHYFNSHSISFMTVKTVQNPHPIKLDVKMEAHHNQVLRVAEVSGYKVGSSVCVPIADSPGHTIPLNPNDCPPREEKTLGSPCVNQTIPYYHHPIMFRQKGLFRHKSSSFKASFEAKKRAINFVRRKIKGLDTPPMQKKKKVRKRRLSHQHSRKSFVVGEKRKLLPYQQDDYPPSKKLVIVAKCLISDLYCNVKTSFVSSSSS